MSLDLPNTRIAITGGAGMLGRSIARQLLDAGADVLAIDQVPLELPEAGDLPGNLEVTTQDVRDREALRALLEGCQGVVHLAAILNIAANKRPRDSFDINLVSTVDILDVLSSVPDARVVLASSIGTYGAPPSPEHVLSEDDPLQGSSLYAISKIAGELYARAYHELTGLDYAALRFGTLYGPWQHRGGVVPRFLHGVLDDIDAGRTPVVEDTPEGEHDWVFVDDAANCVVRALTVEAPNRPVNVVSGHSTSLAEAFSILLDLYGSDAAIEWRPGSSPLPPKRLFDPTRTREVLGYVPDTPLRDGLQAFVDWRAEHLG